MGDWVSKKLLLLGFPDAASLVAEIHKNENLHKSNIFGATYLGPISPRTFLTFTHGYPGSKKFLSLFGTQASIVFVDAGVLDIFQCLRHPRFQGFLKNFVSGNMQSGNTFCQDVACVSGNACSH